MQQSDSLDKAERVDLDSLSEAEKMQWLRTADLDSLSEAEKRQLLRKIDLSSLSREELLELHVRMARGRWFCEFAKRLHSVRRGSSRAPDARYLIRLLGFTPAPAPGVAVVLDVDSDEEGTSIDGEIWLCRPSGRDPRFVVSEAASRIHVVRGSPGAKHLAYVAQPFPPKETWENTALWAVDVRRGQKVRIADGGAMAPAWTPDASQLLLFRLIDGKWQPYRASSFLQKPELGPASELALDAPGSFSRDGQLVAGVIRDGLVAERLATRQRTAAPLPVPMDLEWARWSWDSEWVCAVLRPRYGIVREPCCFAFQPATAALIRLEGALGWVPQRPDKIVTVAGADWVPGRGHRLLLCAEMRAGGTDVRSTDDEPSYRWFIYDADAETSKEVEGFPADPPGDVSWCADGRHVLIGPRMRELTKPF